MKVTLDLSHLLHTGAITAEEHDRLALLGRRDTGSLMVNVLVGFGVLAVAGGCIALVPSVITGLALGVVLMIAGIAIINAKQEAWLILANICVLIAALLIGGGIVLFSQGVSGPGVDGDYALSVPLISLATAYMLVALVFAGSAALAQSSLLASLAVLALFGALGSSTGYGFATYELTVTQPLATVIVFTLLALAAHAASRTVIPKWERLLTTVARTAVFLVNLGFWIGSLWGDRLTWLGATESHLPPIVFSVAWALALFATALWAGWSNRRWVLNLVTVFAGIHFYTQWFEHLGATPVSVVAAGLIVLVFAVVLYRLNRGRHVVRDSSPGPGGVAL